MKTPKQNKKSGAIIVVVMVILVTFTLFVSALLQLSGFNAQETERQIRESQAFWIAEEGVQRSRLDQQDVDGNDGEIAGPSPDFDSETGRVGAYTVVPYESGFLSIGTITIDGVIITNKIYFETDSPHWSYDKTISGLNESGEPWTFLLGGSGSPVQSSGFPAIPGPGDTEVGGFDEIHGNVYAGGENGDIYMGGESHIYEAPDYEGVASRFVGDASAGGSITTVTNNMISGAEYENVDSDDHSAPDLVGMDYPNTATHNLRQIFDAEGVTSGRLPIGHELRDVVRRNGDDYYFEPVSGSGSSWDLVLGEGRVYYAKGNIHFDRNGPYQFDVDGTATIVASGNIHIADGIKYEDGNAGDDLVALIALGEYNQSGNLEDDTGNIYFGDPRYGTVYEMDAFMLAANDFYYNPYSDSNNPQEPDTGFKIFGNFVALNQLHIDRDWYSPEDGGNARPTLFVPGPEGGWVDALDYRDRDSSEPITDFLLSDVEINGGTITETQVGWHRNPNPGWPRYIYGEYEVDIDIDPMRHYRMIVKYDERIYDPETRLSGLPRAGGSGGTGGELTKWQHADADDS